MEQKGLWRIFREKLFYELERRKIEECAVIFNGVPLNAVMACSVPQYIIGERAKDYVRQTEDQLRKQGFELSRKEGVKSSDASPRNTILRTLVCLRELGDPNTLDFTREQPYTGDGFFDEVVGETILGLIGKRVYFTQRANVLAG